MEIRCERCRAPFVLDDGEVTEAGLPVRCSSCGHAFRVKKKALVVTVPLKPDEPDAATPVPTDEAQRAAAAASGRRDPERAASWSLRKRNGDVYPFKDLSVLQKWVVERKALRDEEVSSPGQPWRRLDELPELEPFFSLVERARKATSAAASPAAAGQPPAQPTMIAYPPPPALETPGEAHGEGPVLPGELAPIPPEQWEAPGAGGRAREPAWTADAGARPPGLEDRPLDPAERRAVRGGRGAPLAVLVILALVVAGGGVAWLARPAWLGFQDEGLVARAPVAAPAPPAPAPAPRPNPTSNSTSSTAPASPSQSRDPAPGRDRGQGSTSTSTSNPTAPPDSHSNPLPDPLPAARGEGEKVAAAPASPAPAASPPRPRTARSFIAEGRRLRERGKAQAGLDLFNRALDLDESNADALAGRGLCYLELSQYPGAEASFQAALQAAPEHADALMGLAETYRYQGRRPDAVTYYKKYLAAHPEGEDAVAARNAIEALKE